MSSAVPQDQAESFFDRHAPPGLDLELLQIVLDAYPIAHQQAEGYAFEEAHDLRPHIRRATIEGRLASLPARYAGLSTTPVRNATGNAYHREVYFGRVVLTHSAITAPESKIREARFRESLARSCNLPLFAEYADVEPVEDGLLWAVLTHGPADDQRVPAFVRIAFPLADGSHSCDMDLVARRRSLAVVRPSATVVGEPAPTLRPDIVVPGMESEAEGS